MNQNPRAKIALVLLVIALVFINAGVYYANRIIKQASQATKNQTAQTGAKVQLDKQAFTDLKLRTHVDVDKSLEPTIGTRQNPFSSQ